MYQSGQHTHIVYLENTGILALLQYFVEGAGFAEEYKGTTKQSAGVMPYYLHVLDKVQGAAHFMVSDDEARQIMRELLTLVSGYLVPKLAREIGGEPSKTPLDLQLRQQ